MCLCGAEATDGRELCGVCRLLVASGLPRRSLLAKKSDCGAELSEHFDSHDSLFIYGQVGVGKTWLMAALMRQAAEHFAAKEVYFPGRFVSVQELLLRLRQANRVNSDDSEGAILDMYGSVPLLYLDDMAAERTTDYALASLYLLIERRNNEPRFRTIITSNLNMREIAEHYGQRIASRIAGMCKVVKLTGPDRRLR